MQRLPTWTLLGAIIVLVGAAGFWAGRTAMLPPDDPLAGAAELVTYEVVEQTIGRSLRFTAVAEWGTAALARARTAGIVTSVDFAAGAPVEAGDVLYTVNLRPVVVAGGDVPAFRDMGLGDDGADVAQLQAMLVALGHLNAEPDGGFGVETEAATLAWQASLGMEDDGVVRLGDVVFAPELPTRVLATDALVVGAELTGGEVVVDALSSAPKISVPLSPEQRDLIPLSGPVAVAYPDGSWHGVVARAAEPSGEGSGTLELILEASDGGPLCGEECVQWIPPLGRTDFDTEIVLVPETTGPVVPLAAIATDPGGAQTVRLADGTEVPVEVRASTGGLAVVSGVQPGDVLVLPFTEPSDG